MRAGCLLVPAKRRFNLSVRHTVTVANHKMVADAKPCATELIFSIPMSRIDGRNVTTDGRRVMQHNVSPLMRFNRWAKCLLKIYQINRPRSFLTLALYVP